MKTASYQSPMRILFFICTLLLVSCAETKTEEAAAPEAEQESPMLEMASQEYSELAQTHLNLMAALDFDTWQEQITDDVKWYWPDGSSATRSTIEGKENLVAWWKNWKETTGASLSFENNSFLPIQVNEPSNYYKVVGTGVITYTDLTITMGDKSTSVRQNIVFMFNDDKKVSHAFLYYDRTGIVELTNMMLGDAPAEGE